ncbi:tripartite motif-containing protein 2-like isoform X2 [Haliotis rubra]|uniref:tripartite motif-containing protein 2-like isoform X2 n=1 Tax=Haliotis rubra TaxID=36100 RepID=UPI001EE582A5|nr:tripartite motif-containing protein 2-like isoform X2 [Haliotis rubra]
MKLGNKKYSTWQSNIIPQSFSVHMKMTETRLCFGVRSVRSYSVNSARTCTTASDTQETTPCTTLGDIAPQNLVCETNCRIHNRYPLDLFDKRCNTSICSRCLRGEHAGHEVEDLDEAALGGKQRIEQHVKDLSSLLSDQQTHLQSIRQDIKFTDGTQNTLTETIALTFQSLRSQLDQREKELLIDLESQTKETKETLHALQTSCETEHVRCNDVSGYIRKSLLYASKSALLKLESSVDRVTRTYLETASPQTYDVATAVFNTNGLSKLKSDMSGFGTITALKEETARDRTDDKETLTDDIFATLTQKHEMMLAEKDRSLQAASETINRLQTFLNSCPTGGCVHVLKTAVPDRHMVLHCEYIITSIERIYTCHSLPIHCALLYSTLLQYILPWITEHTSFRTRCLCRHKATLTHICYTAL